MTTHEKVALKSTAEENLIMCHFGWPVNMRNEFGMWKGNEALIRSCKVDHPDDASMAIVRTVGSELTPIRVGNG
jgi:hypothetical protein